jgi:drug/metabolite transporter (DMT)-like permease
MDPFVFFAVLFAAACHAGWNAVVKIGLEPFATMTLIAVASGLVALPMLFWFGLPAAAAWPFVAATMVLHVGYYLGLAEAYRVGDLGQMYPIARGTAPLLTAAIGALVLHEGLEPLARLGIGTLAGGVILMSARGGREAKRPHLRAVAAALFTACTICGYSLVDGTGARIAGDAHAYTMTLFVCNGALMALVGLARRGPAIAVDMARYWKSGFAGGGLSLVAYWIVIWAMTVEPIALVAALRETSVLFAAGIAVFWVGEPLRLTRVAAALMIVVGLVLMRLQ